MKEENIKSGLIKRANSDLKKSEFNLDILNSILSQTTYQIQYERLVNFFKDNSNDGIILFLKYHKLDKERLQNLKAMLHLNLGQKIHGIDYCSYITKNENIFWTKTLLEEYKQLINWRNLSLLKNVDWSVILIKKFHNEFDCNWEELSSNENLPFNNELIDSFYKNWKWDSLSSNPNFINKIDLLVIYANKLNWEIISKSISGELSDEDILKIEKYLDWDGLALYGKINWKISQLIKFENKLSKYFIPYNPNLPWREILEIDYCKFHYHSGQKILWTKDFIRSFFIQEEKYRYTEMANLISIKEFEWDEGFVDEMVKEFENHYRWEDNFWEAFSSNPSIPWTVELINKYESKLIWYSEYNSWYPYNNRGLSGNPNLPWSEKFIEIYIDKWDWTGLSLNKGIPWSLELIEKYYDKWNWDELKLNTTLPWSKDFLIKYKENWLTNQYEYRPSSYRPYVDYWPSIYDNKAIHWNIDIIIDSINNNIEDEAFTSSHLSKEEYYIKYGTTKEKLLARKLGFRSYHKSVYLSIREKIGNKKMEELFDFLIKTENKVNERFNI
jgi:hypothetical protein